MFRPIRHTRSLTTMNSNRLLQYNSNSFIQHKSRRFSQYTIHKLGKELNSYKTVGEKICFIQEKRSLYALQVYICTWNLGVSTTLAFITDADVFFVGTAILSGYFLYNYSRIYNWLTEN
jgi:hypothetical protein